jgi:hypothetical protein
VIGWLDPLSGLGYQFWSGIGSGSPILAGVAVFLRHHNCSTKGCWRPGHYNPVTHTLACRRHPHP